MSIGRIDCCRELGLREMETAMKQQIATEKDREEGQTERQVIKSEREINSAVPDSN